MLVLSMAGRDSGTPNGVPHTSLPCIYRALGVKQPWMLTHDRWCIGSSGNVKKGKLVICLGLLYSFIQYKILHGSLEAILGRTKLSTKTKTGDGWGMVPGVPNKFQSNPICFFPPQNFQKFIFSSVCQLQVFFWYIFRGQISFTSFKALSRI